MVYFYLKFIVFKFGMSKLIVIKENTEELLQNLRIGDETYNSIIWRNLKERRNEVENATD